VVSIGGQHKTNPRCDNLQLPEIVRRRAEKFLQKFIQEHAPAHLRDQYRLEYRVRRSSITLYECRPPWSPSVKKWTKRLIAQFRYNVEEQQWSLYYPNQGHRWQACPNIKPSPDMKDLLHVLDADPAAVFFG